MKSAVVSLIGVAGLATAALGQAGYLIDVDYGMGQTSVNPGNPTCILRVAAKFSPNDFAYAASQFNMNAGDGLFANPLVLLPVGANPGTINNNVITGIVVGQIHFPPPLPANPANPIAIYRVEWSTANFATRVVNVDTRAVRFDVYPSATSPTSQSRLSGLMEGHAGIVVTPAPSALALLGLGGLVAGRRRR